MPARAAPRPPREAGFTPPRRSAKPRTLLRSLTNPTSAIQTEGQLRRQNISWPSIPAGARAGGCLAWPRAEGPAAGHGDTGRFTMGAMMALRRHARGGPGQLVYEQAPAPAAGPGEVLIAVHAAAITLAELAWDLTWITRDGAHRAPGI